MKIQFEATREDYQALFEFSQKQLMKMATNRVILFFKCVLAIILTAIVLAIFDIYGTWYFISLKQINWLLMLLMLAVTTLVCILYLQNKSAKNNLLKPDVIALGHHELLLEENGLLYEHAFAKAQLPWKALRALHEEEDAIILAFPNSFYLRIPGRAFHAGKEKKEFLELLKQHLNK